MGVAPGALATNSPFFPQTSFAIDGNRTGPNDFATGYGPGTTPSGYPTTGLYYNKRTIDMNSPTGSGCDLAGDDASGDKLSDGPIWPIDPDVSVNGKTDIDYIDVAAEKVAVNGQIHDILYVGYMKCGGNGTWQTALYLDDGDGLTPSQGDKNGDYLFVFSFTPSNDSVTIRMSTMANGVWGPLQLLNTTVVDGRADDDYGEVAINLTRLGVLPENACRTVNAGGQAAALTGGSLTSTLKDLVTLPSLPISNCGALDVKKVGTSPGMTSPDLFHYVVDQSPKANAADVDIVHDGSLKVNLNGSGSTTEPDTTYTELDASITLGGVHNWTNVNSQPDYKIVEDTIPDPWTLKTITCTYTDIFATSRPTKTVTIYEDGAYTANRFLVPPATFANATVPPASCTITNEATALTLNKVLPNDHGGTKTSADFVLSATGANNVKVINSADPKANDPTVGATKLVKPGTYTLAETPATTPGYTTSAWTCVDGAGATVAVNSSSQVTVTAGQSVICSITNDDKPAKLTLVKKVTNDNGGAAAASAWTLTATGPTTGVTGATGSTPVTAREVAAGTYTLSESGPTGYTASAWSCVLTGTTTAVTVTAAKVALGLGDDVTCTITNDDQQGKLTLDKILINDNGGTLTSGTWTLKATNTTNAATTPVSGNDDNPEPSQVLCRFYAGSGSLLSAA